MFDHFSPQLKGLAYRMLGSFAEAEDMVQEALLRLHQTNPKPASEEAFLYRVVSNLCLDRLRRLKVERKHYFGPWLPEPVTDAALDVAEVTEAAEDLDFGLLLLMENLSPAERVVYVLREAFDFSYQEISDLLEITAATARQRAHRAKVRLGEVSGGRGEPASADWGTRRQQQKQMLGELASTMASGNIDKLVDMMTDDVVALTDGGGLVSAAIRPITTPQRIAQVAVFLVQKTAKRGAVTSHFVAMNGGWGLVNVQAGEVHSCTQIEMRDNKVWRVYVMRNPQKLQHLAHYLELAG